MRTDIPAPSDPTLQKGDGLQILIATSGSAYHLSIGQATTLDLFPFATTVKQRFAECRLDLAHNGELSGANRPRPGRPVQILRSGVVVWTGVVESTTEPLSRGRSRIMNVVLRRRDGTEWWREVRRATPLFSVGTDLGAMARSVAEMLTLHPDEYDIDDLGVNLTHDSTQLADLNAWEMLRLIGEPALVEPFVDARGVLKYVSRDIRRTPDIILPWSSILSIDGAKSRYPVTTVKVRWLDPVLAKVTQQEQVLTTDSLMCGFFKWQSTHHVWWSKDHTLRAENVYMDIKQSINDGGLVSVMPVGTETFEVTSPYGGRIQTTFNAWNALLLAHEVGLLMAANMIPEPVITEGVGATVGHTVPWYKGAAKSAAELLLWSTLFRIGQGLYEIKGIPYDFVHNVNETDAYDMNADPWDDRTEVIENDLVPDQAASEGLAVGELFYRAKSASQGSMVIADDPRVERGDILQVPDGRRFYVLDGARDLTRGAVRKLALEGFWA